MAEVPHIDVDFVGLQGLYDSLRRVAAIIRGRKNDGWSLFRSDETWVYHTATDAPELTCPVCLQLAQHMNYNGDEVKRDFPAREIIESTVVRPNVHEDPQYSFLKGRCRCIMYFDDHVGTLTFRLHREIGEVA